MLILCLSLWQIPWFFAHCEIPNSLIDVIISLSLVTFNTGFWYSSWGSEEVHCVHQHCRNLCHHRWRQIHCRFRQGENSALLFKATYALDICIHISAADGDMQMQFVNHSEVKFVCVRSLRLRTWIRHWSLFRKIWISHWPIPNVQLPSHSQSLRQSLCGHVGEHQIACGDWLVCQTTPVYNIIPCTAQILARAFCAYICSDVTWTAILNWGPFGRWTPGRVCLPTEPAFCTFSNTFSVRSHRDQHQTTCPHAVNPLMTNVWLLLCVTITGCIYVQCKCRTKFFWDLRTTIRRTTSKE